MNTQAVSEWNIEIQHHRTRLLGYLLLAATIGGAVAMILHYTTLPETMDMLERLTVMIPFVASWLVVLIAWLRRSIDYRIRALTLVLIAFLLSVIVFARGGLAGSGRIWLLLPPVLAFALIGLRSGIAAGVISVLTYAFFVLAISQKWVVPQVAEDLSTLPPLVGEGSSFVLAVIILIVILWAFNQGRLEALIKVGTAHGQLQAKAQELVEANERLRRQASQLQATAKIAQTGTSILNVEALLVAMVHQIQEGFSPMGVYYVGLFLLDEAQQFAVLRAATGEAGQLLLEMGHKLELDETTMVGWCIIHKQARIALGVDETVQFGHPLLGFTRSEIALPLQSRERVLGALSVQSAREAAFSETDVAILQTMANQVAVAIDNANLFSQARAALEDVQAVQRRYLAQAWREFLAVKPVARIDYTQPGTEQGDESFLREVQRTAMVRERTVAIDSPSSGPDGGASASQTALAVPLKLRGQIIGTITLHETRQQRPWTAEEIALAETVAEQAALTVENLRLMDEAQRRAAREQLVSEISGRVRASLDPDTILKTTVRELGRVLGVQRTAIEVAGPRRDDGSFPEEKPAHVREE